jgi:hypothetical protein
MYFRNKTKYTENHKEATENKNEIAIENQRNKYNPMSPVP